VVEERRKFYSEQEARAQQRKMQALYASLIAGGAGVLSADPQKGYAASLGEGIKAGLPVAAAGMEDYYESTEKAKELEREEGIAGRTYNLETAIQKWKSQRETLTDEIEIEKLDVLIQTAAAELEQTRLAAGVGLAGEPDTTRTENTILEQFYGGEKLLTLGPASQLYRSLMAQAYQKVMDRIGPEGAMPGDVRFNQMMIEEAVPLFKENEDNLKTGRPTNQPDGAGVGGSAADAIQQALDED